MSSPSSRSTRSHGAASGHFIDMKLQAAIIFLLVLSGIFPPASGQSADDRRALDQALLEGARLGRSDVVAAALDRGASIGAREPRFGHSALTFAAREGHFDVALLLLERGASPNDAETKTGYSALAHAARRDDIELLAELLVRGARV